MVLRKVKCLLLGS